MSAVSFDTLQFVKTLEASGIESKQAEGIAAAYRVASADQNVLTKPDLQMELVPLKAELATVKAELASVKWMTGMVMGGVVALIVKSFF